MLIRPYEEYSKAYPNISFDRSEDGILEVKMHTDGGPMLWGAKPHGQLANMWSEVAMDDDNKIIILTGSGDMFIKGMRASELPSVKENPDNPGQFRADAFEHSLLNVQGKRIMQAHLDVEVPIIAAVNGPVAVHPEQAFLCDIVLAAESATFKDGVHFVAGQLPGDGIHVVCHEAMGLNRMRYFLLTGQELTARQAMEWGLVNEVLPLDQLMPRARELAKIILRQPRMVVRHTRQILVHQIKNRMQNEVGFGLAIETLASAEYFPAQA
jgi:enoyl-CoA hydratase/carnithine racemase